MTSTSLVLTSGPSMVLTTATLPLVVVSIAAAIAAFTDVFRFKVYNGLTFPVLFSGCFYHIWKDGWEGAATSLLGVGAAFAILLVPYLIGGLGAGDVKFFMSLGAWLGMGPLVPVFALGALATAGYSVVQALRGKRLSSLWWHLQVSCLRLLLMGRMLAADDCREDVHSYVDHQDRRKRLIPFSAMLALGLFLTLFWIDLKFE